jgi:hypothetical protein
VQKKRKLLRGRLPENCKENSSSIQETEAYALKALE